ncbi:MAG TPA: cysteine desulfurase CsdA, partial [Prevotellaceae bacterium]|nr:cysteine desulfurase CsdA [Prevotellaceae bacterium]
EHHSNIVPWQLLRERQGIRIRVIPMTDDGYLCLDSLEKLFNERTRLVSVAHVSNVLGTVNPVAEIVRMAHAHDVPVLVDGAQSAPHMPIDVSAMDCDFFAFSGHKLYGPTGIGVLYGKEKWLDRMPPYMGGGEMIKSVSFEHTTFNDLPYKFEAGTPDYVASTGLARAIDYINALGMEQIEAHERDLTRYALEQMSLVPGMHIYGPRDTARHDAVVSFQVGRIHHLDMGTLLDRLGIAVRTGHHCAEPLMHRLGIEGTCRASFALYNTRAEVDTLVQGIGRVRGMLE